LFGKRAGKQRYRCTACRKAWTSKPRPQRLTANIWHAYVFELRTVSQLAAAYGRSDEWVRTKLASYVPPRPVHRPRPVVVVMDVTYFASWGVLVVIDPNASAARHENRVLYYAFLEGTERTVDYEVALDTLEGLGYTVCGATIDGRRGVRELLQSRDIPVQCCQFHQLQTITRCLTRRPLLLPNQELRSIALTLTETTSEQLSAGLDTWHAAYGTWLKQKEPGTTRFVHPRTRRAYFSLRRNLPNLFVYQQPALLRIPNTTNALDGRFGVWKQMLQRHRGCSRTLKTKILRSLFVQKQG
jgi:hypothetical protein